MFAFVDVETTGLDLSMDFLLEVGLVITDDNLNIVESFSTPIWSMASIIRRAEENEIVREMHTANGLLAACRDREDDNVLELWRAQNILMGIMAKYPETPMCGSSVHFDRAMLQRWMPALEEMFHYRNIDVSTMKELAERWWPNIALSRPADRKLHRVIPDIEDSIAELYYYREYIDSVIEFST